jgi:hypothetical protein
VCAYTGGSGFRRCRWYTLCGWLLLYHLGYTTATVQAGRLALQPDPTDPTLWIEMDPSQGVLGEIHCWIAVPGADLPPGRHEMTSAVEVVDFTARHYADYVAQARLEDGSAARWKREKPPAFIWGQAPEWAIFDTQGEPTKHLIEGLEHAEGRDLLVLAHKYLHASS